MSTSDIGYLTTAFKFCLNTIKRWYPAVNQVCFVLRPENPVSSAEATEVVFTPWSSTTGLEHVQCRAERCVL